MSINEQKVFIELNGTRWTILPNQSSTFLSAEFNFAVPELGLVKYYADDFNIQRKLSKLDLKNPKLNHAIKLTERQFSNN